MSSVVRRHTALSAAHTSCCVVAGEWSVGVGLLGAGMMRARTRDRPSVRRVLKKQTRADTAGQDDRQEEAAMTPPPPNREKIRRRTVTR